MPLARLSDMPTAARGRVRIAAIADLHFTRTSQGAFQPLFARVTEAADVLLICGDLTDYGLAEEARLLAKEITSSLKIPAIAVLGNHDYEGGQPDEIRSILNDAGVVVLDGDAYEIHGVGFAGVKGFAGGFDRGTLGPWGETVIKNFVREAVDEALKLETALARLRNDSRVALLHYSPIRATVEGEPPEIFPFLGCSRLEEPIVRYPVTAVFHGHAHHGRTEGHTRNDVPVFNVSMSLLRATTPDRPFRIIEIAATSAGAAGDAAERRSGGDRRVPA
ncbi:MAG TPA: metallophosphoesterase [Vicinamibacterales bacterium]|nr:metallophosphoesterase [Vicinamibacterales bacterium]